MTSLIMKEYQKDGYIPKIINQGIYIIKEIKQIYIIKNNYENRNINKIKKKELFLYIYMYLFYFISF